MTQAAIEDDSKKYSPLQQARALVKPSRQEMLMRALSVQSFWNSNQQLLVNAWKEWAESEQLGELSETLLNANLQQAVANAWAQPATEASVKNLWHEASPGVFTAQFFEPTELSSLRQFLDSAAKANIPLRPPYGLVLNRHGAMLDERSEGYLAAPQFQAFYRMLLDKYMRPVARLLFPEIVGYDTQTFGFSIRWQAGMDTSLRLHTDASAVTMNINMNLPGEDFTGSEVDFYDPSTGKLNRLTFKPGMAMIHRGNVAHASQPILTGERTNMVLWLYGDNMQIPMGNKLYTAEDAAQRWVIPASNRDSSAPF